MTARRGPVLCFLLFLFSGNLFAQKENSTWYFGKGLGLKFDGGNVSLLPQNKNMRAYWGSSTVCDPVTGQLLFYTDGLNVYASNHTMMQNGLNIVNTSSTVEVISVPYPGKKGMYYVFVTNFANQLFYAIVDMHANGGKGAVTIKNQLIKTSVNNHFAIVRHAYEDGYWLITHGASLGTDTTSFFAYRITRDGLDPKYVESKTGFSVQPDTYTSGEMTTSADGTSLFFAFLDKAGLFKIDKTCGKVIFLADLSRGFAGIQHTGGAFSPNGKKLFVTFTWLDGSSMLAWYDLTQQPKDMFVGIVTLSSPGSPDGIYMSAELAPDGRIYMTTSENGAVTGKLHVIHKPDEDPINWQFERWFIQPPNANTYWTEGLPSLIQDKSPGASNAPDFDISNGCTGEPSSVSLRTSLDADSFLWDFGDSLSGAANYSTEKNPTHIYAAGGKYNLTFSWYKCGYEYRRVKPVEIAQKPVALLPEKLTVCPEDSILITAGIGQGRKYQWDHGATDSAIYISRPGMYRVKISTGSCSITDSIIIENYPSIWVRLGKEYFICEEENELRLLDAGKGFEHYLWHPTGDTTQWIKVARTGDYYVIVEDFNGCSGSAGTEVKRRCPQYVYFPNAFSPNGDGINDIFKPVGQDIVSYSISVYNRWGQRIFETADYTEGWDGELKGIPVPADVYFWQASYSGYDKSGHLRKKYDSGTVTLLR